ncbi:ibr domain containing protein [Niveomyces insectorum RCEF 264]|uniref:Ibr domain containing protein n=1 Tax=Niveomyces insectorum RCEF 264 TaxID=1081102 RepID=A0A167M5Z4_9HYPO|nr:ibr domain containing protein [Niveomyces insectorum RCEF 264]
MDDLDRMKTGTADRRVFRDARKIHEREIAELADRELEDLREALRMVDEIEQIEARKVKQRRLANRRRLQQLRAHREAALRAEIALKYTDLRAALTSLMKMQQDPARRTRRIERAVRIRDDAQRLAAFDAAQTETRATLHALCAYHTREAERAWIQDYQERLRLEQSLEAAYRGELAKLWVGHPNQRRLEAAALEEYMRRNDMRFDEYLHWREHESEARQYLAEEERSMQDELLERERVSHVESKRTTAMLQQKRHAAELIWCQVINEERHQLLAELEQLEQELGLAASTAPVDNNLLLLMELEEAHRFSKVAGRSSARPTFDDMDHYYTMRLSDAAAEMGFFVPSGDGENDNE